MSTKPEIPAAIEAAAEQVVREHPGVHAVLLFGSRARGDHHPRSDYDIAAIGPHASLAMDPLRAAHPNIDTVHSATQAELRERANVANAIEASIVRQGIVIAGRWNPPRYRTGHLDVNTDNLIQNLRTAQLDLATAAKCTRAALLQGSLADNDAATKTFDGAERTTKALIWSCGAVPKTTHDLAALADQLEDELDTPHDPKERRLFAARLRALNGLSPQGHQAAYAGAGLFEIIERTADRLAEALALHGETLQRVAEHHHPTTTTTSQRARALRRIHRLALETANEAATLVDTQTPQPLRHAAAQWLRNGANASRVLARRVDALSSTAERPTDRLTLETDEALKQKTGATLDTDPGPAPPPAAPPKTPTPTSPRRGLARLAATIRDAPKALRHYLGTDPEAPTPASAHTWQDLTSEAADYLETAPGEQRRADYLTALTTTVTGEPEPRSEHHAQAATELAYRSRVIRATEDASAIRQRALVALDHELASDSEQDLCDRLDSTTEQAARAATRDTPFKEREQALLRIGTPLKAGRRDHIDHIIDLLPQLNWRLAKIERRLGLIGDQPLRL